MKRLTQFLKLKATPTTEECFDFVVKSIREYCEDFYFDDCYENIFKVNEAGDFSALMNIYGLEGALKIAEADIHGYVIAGHNFPLEKVIFLNKTNYWSIYTDMFTKDIFDRIVALNESGSSVENIQMIYPSVDVERLLEEVEKDKEITLTIKLKRGETKCEDCPFHMWSSRFQDYECSVDNPPFDCNKFNITTMEIVK